MKDISRIFLVLVLSALLAAFLSACGDSGGTSTIIGGTPGGGGTPSSIPGNLSGAVWKDLNQDKLINLGEPGIPGVTMDLFIDSNENGSFDLTDELVATTTTDSNGNYIFTVTTTGRYFVSVIVDNPAIAGLLLTTNSDELTLDRPLVATLRADITDLRAGVENLNFGFVSPTKWSFDISGNSSSIGIVSSPAIASDGTIYAGSGNGSLYAITTNGILKWKYQTGGALTASPAIGSDGTVYIGSADRQFYAINPDGTLKWIFPTKANFTSSAAIGADGTIYAAGTNQDKTIFPCVSGSSCATITNQICGGILPPCPTGQICVGACAIPTTQACSQNNPCPTGETCVSGQPVPFNVTTQLGTIFAINPNGTEKWEFLVNKSGFSNISGLSGIVNSSPAVASDGTIYIGTEGDVTFDRSDFCDNLSTYPASDVDPSFPVNGHLYAINPDGTLKQDFKTLGAVDSSPAIGGDGTVYVGSKRTLKLFYGQDHSMLMDENPSTMGFVYAINQNGTIKWFVDLFGDVDSSPAIGSDGIIYIGADNFHVYALNPANGATKWVEPTRDEVKSSPAIASDGTIYIGSNDGSLYAFNPDGTLKKRYIIGGTVNSSPSIGADGTVYFATGGGDDKVYAIIGSSILADTPWPKFRHDLKNTGRK